MRISRIRINNFRSIKNADITLSAFNVFVGRNNHGKTNLFEAIEWFYSGKGDIDKIKYLHDPGLEVSVDLEFESVQEGIESVKNESTKEKFRKFAADKDVIRVKRTSSDIKKRLLLEDNGEWSAKNFAGFDNSFNDCLPRLEYVATTTRLDDVSTFAKKTPIGLMLSGVLTTILEASQKYKELRDKFSEVFSDEDSDIRAELSNLSGKVKVHLEQQFPECTKVSFDVAIPEFDELLKNFDTSVDDGVETTAEEKGDGMQRALMLAIIKTFADFRREHEKLGKCFVFMIDEAELHLHPTAQRQLKQALLSLAKNGDQVLINTHSSVLVTDTYDIQFIFQVEKADRTTEIRLVRDFDKPYIIFELLGGSPADLLLPQNFIIVEGKSEFEFLSRVIKRLFSEKKLLQVLWASGDIVQQERSMYAVSQAYSPLRANPIYKEKVVFLTDKPNSTQKAGLADFKRNYKDVVEDGRLFELPTESIEESYPSTWRKTSAEAKSMGSAQKVSLAKEVGDQITLSQLNSEMKVISDVVEKAWSKAYK